MPVHLGNRYHNGTVHKCAQAVEKAGYSVFGVQHGGQCWSGPQAHITYNKYGTSNQCAHGSGGFWTQDVYKIISKQEVITVNVLCS